MFLSCQWLKEINDHFLHSLVNTRPSSRFPNPNFMTDHKLIVVLFLAKLAQHFKSLLISLFFIVRLSTELFLNLTVNTLSQSSLSTLIKRTIKFIAQRTDLMNRIRSLVRSGSFGSTWSIVAQGLAQARCLEMN